MQQPQARTAARLLYTAIPAAYLVLAAHHRRHALAYTVILYPEMAARLAQMALAAAAQLIPVLAATQQRAAGASHASKF
ncbi:MAG: hypothetical protein COA52_04685 [Hyphomicrobiales bacterium]|nr:MAG: hypothetical protein COA52_04685 [Hyphomicrobiales bacterium]